MNHFISLSSAITMTSRFRANRENVLDSFYRGQNILALSETFDRSAFDTLLAKSGCTGLRIYYGMGEDLKIHAIIVAVNENNEDMIPENSLNNNEDDDDDDIVDSANRCPELCPPSSPLNG